SDGQIIGVIPIDSVYSPVIRVRYKTEDTRVGQKTNYDRLIMEIWTNGTISPEMALVEAAKILRKHLNAFVQHFEPGDSLDAELNVEFQPAAPALNEALSAKLNQPISVLDLSVRASNCLESAKIHTIGELLKLSENDLLKVRSFGKTSLREVKRKLQDIGLTLGLSPDATFGGSEPKTRVVHSEDGLTVTIFLEDGRICVDGLDMPENAAIRSGMGSIGGKKTIYIDVLKSANDSVNQWTAKSLDRKVIRVSNVSDLEVGPHPWGNFDRDNVAHIDIPKLFR
ncbi:MAG: DNA-directed RNA polymerase subunit alpha C-terminal domain-containing protein, partial [Phycisphaerae bacterium]